MCELLSSQPDPRLVCVVSGGVLTCRASDGSALFWGCVDPSGETPTAGLYILPAVCDRECPYPQLLSGPCFCRSLCCITLLCYVDSLAPRDRSIKNFLNIVLSTGRHQE